MSAGVAATCLCGSVRPAPPATPRGVSSGPWSSAGRPAADQGWVNASEGGQTPSCVCAFGQEFLRRFRSNRSLARRAPVDLLLEGIQLRRLRRPAIGRRLARPRRPPHRVAIAARPPGDLLDRDTADEVHAPDPPPTAPRRPTTSSWLARSNRRPGFTPARTPTRQPPGGAFQPARGGEYSGGADIRR
jgi:hypothetical protein